MPWTQVVSSCLDSWLSGCLPAIPYQATTYLLYGTTPYSTTGRSLGHVVYTVVVETKACLYSWPTGCLLSLLRPLIPFQVKHGRKHTFCLLHSVYVTEKYLYQVLSWLRFRINTVCDTCAVLVVRQSRIVFMRHNSSCDFSMSVIYRIRY